MTNPAPIVDNSNHFRLASHINQTNMTIPTEKHPLSREVFTDKNHRRFPSSSVPVKTWPRKKGVIHLVRPSRGTPTQNKVVKRQRERERERERSNSWIHGSALFPPH